MDVDDDLDRVRTATETIRRLSDIASDSDGEEFVGFNEVSSSSSDESDDSERASLIYAGSISNPREANGGTSAETGRWSWW